METNKMVSGQIKKEKQEELMQSDFESCHTCASFMKSESIDCKTCKKFSNWTMAYNMNFMD